MELLRGAIQNYAWGSRTVIARLQGRSVPSPGPEAELWLGGHPGGVCVVERGPTSASLGELITAQPRRWLGEEALGRFGPRLPFLLKVLAAREPLSLQAHPDAEQARSGYASAEEAVRRNYRDPYHKPELLVAVSPFEALCGFRDPRFSAEVLDSFAVASLDPVVAALRAGGRGGLAEAVRRLLTWPTGERAALVGAVTSAVVADDFAPQAELARRLAKRYPADPGVLVALLLNHVRLSPGEGIWMPAGNLHAYLRGAGVEVMAASDNVLRGGLTPKHVDVPELLKVLRFEVLDEPVRKPMALAPGVLAWPVPVDDFALHAVSLDVRLPQVRLAVPGPRVVLCLSGEVLVDDGEGRVTVGPGQAGVGSAGCGPLMLAGAGKVYVASVGGAGFPRSA